MKGYVFERCNPRHNFDGAICYRHSLMKLKMVISPFLFRSLHVYILWGSALDMTTIKMTTMGRKVRVVIRSTPSHKLC